MPEFLIALALLAAVAVAVFLVARKGRAPARIPPPQPGPAAAPYTGLPTGVTRSPSGWYSCGRCGGSPCWRCAQRNWRRRRRF
jgi:hypothetical protein